MRTYVEAVELLKQDRDFSKPYRDKVDFHRDNVFQIWNVEYVRELARTIKTLKAESPFIEVCAGDGTLSEQLKVEGVNITATDDKSWSKYREFNYGRNVFNLEAIASIKRYKPELVIASWIPYGNTLDYKILKTGVKHFIVIGETSGGCCGSNDIWDKYESLGYKMITLDNADEFNLCRTDWIHEHYNKIHKHSETVLFTKRRLKYERNKGRSSIERQ